MTAYRHPRLRALPDIANAYRRSMPPSAADLAQLLPFSDILHFKDYSNTARRFVAIGEGDIPFTTLLAATLPPTRGTVDADDRDARFLGAGCHHPTLGSRPAPDGRWPWARMTCGVAAKDTSPR